MLILDYILNIFGNFHYADVVFKMCMLKIAQTDISKM